MKKISRINTEIYCFIIMILNEDYFDKVDIDYDETERADDDMDQARTDINL